jgi:hypothetical protein
VATCARLGFKLNSLMPHLADFRAEIRPTINKLIDQGYSKEKTLEVIEISVLHQSDKGVRDALMLEAGKFYDELVSLA